MLDCINLDGLITNLENTELLYTGLYIININVKEEGYLNIIIEREFIRIDEKIYKIGSTNNIRRYKQCPKDSKIIYAIIHDKYKKWILQFIEISINFL